MMSAPGRHCKNRLFEWTMTAGLLGSGVLQLYWPDALEHGKFQSILDTVRPGSLALFCLVFGWVRAVALYLNGNWPLWGALVRAIGATAGALVLTQMLVSVVFFQLAITGPPSLIVPFLLAFTGAEICSAYRAASDARYR